MDLVLELLPEQVKLIPDAEAPLSAGFGWDFVKDYQFLRGIIGLFKAIGFRVSIFADAFEVGY